jgi:hypothetical protein
MAMCMRGSGHRQERTQDARASKEKEHYTNQDITTHIADSVSSLLKTHTWRAKGFFAAHQQLIQVEGSIIYILRQLDNAMKRSEPLALLPGGGQLAKPLKGEEADAAACGSVQTFK